MPSSAHSELSWLQTPGNTLPTKPAVPSTMVSCPRVKSIVAAEISQAATFTFGWYFLFQNFFRLFVRVWLGYIIYQEKAAGKQEKRLGQEKIFSSSCLWWWMKINNDPFLWHSTVQQNFLWWKYPVLVPLATYGRWNVTSVTEEMNFWFHLILIATRGWWLQYWAKQL